MDPFELLLREVLDKPSVAGLQMICAQIEAYENYKPQRVKDMALKAIRKISEEGTLASQEDMLRLYKLLAKYSRKMGSAKIFEKLEEEDLFRNSLKFHLLWAESYAKEANLTKFSNVLELAKRRLHHLSTFDVEAGFRDLVDQYFPSCDLFNDEETMAAFCTKKPSDSRTKKSRRRSSLAVIEARAKDTFKSAEAPKKGSFGPKSRTDLRFELVDRPQDGYIAPSMEEFRAAMLADEQMADAFDIFDNAPMDITSPAHEVMVSHAVLTQRTTTIEQKELGKRSRLLETVEECESDFSNEDKRRRVFSAAAPVPSSRIFGSHKEKSPEQPPVATTQSSSKSPFISGSSFTEKAYSDMKAMFSDTVVLNKGNLPGITNETTLPVQPPAVETFEVYVDEDVTLRVAEKEKSENVANELRQSGFSQNAERLPLHPIPLQPAAGDARGQLEKLEDEIRGFDVKEFGKPRQLIIEDEETVAGAKFSVLGIDKKPERGIVTSTPAHPLPHPPTHEDFFAPLNHVLEEQMKEVQNEEEIYAQSAFMRRRSVAPAANPVATVTKVPAPKARTVQAAERSMELALDKMNLGDSKQMEKEPDDDAEGDHDRTGVGLADEEITSAINPWDRRVRAEILKQAHKPCYQHDFDIPCPRVTAGKTVNFGGENYNIVDLIGQGGFAKVFKCINEEKKTLALKYEIPSCPWEVYICSEAKMRIDRSKHFVLKSIMEVTEAYVFSNASVLFNEYHPHGTLLDLSNKWVDPSWYIVALIGIQMAKILRELHAVKIIHGDIKPDNFMILGKLSDCRDDINKIFATPIVKLIDWGRAIDMRVLGNQTFTGRAGTEKFDCPEMLESRPWTYQTDYFGYVGTLHVIIHNKYADVSKVNGVYKVKSFMKRRLGVRESLEVIFQEFLNIPDCDHMPGWDKAIQALEGDFRKKFAPLEWRQAVTRFNSFF